jgi:type I restriction enzyme S subunit
VYALAVSLPPTNEQRRIVAKIEELFSELDKGIQSLTAAREQLKAYRQSVLKAAFDGKLSGDAMSDCSSRPSCQLRDLIEFLTSGSRGWADYYSDHGDLFIRAQNLKNDCLDLSDVAYVKLPEDKMEGIRTKVQLGDVLITITGANVTKTGLVDRYLETGYVSQHVALCRPTCDLLPEFLYWYLLSEAGGRKQLNEAAYGAGKPGLNLENIRNVVIPLPSLEEQKAVVDQIRGLMDKSLSMDAEIVTALACTEELRQSILKRAFSGQLVPQDPTDEPASALLARIRAERAKGNPKKQPKSKKAKQEAA